jgi:nitroreductase
MIIILISEIKTHPKVPEIEQMLSTAAAAENILLALNALNYAGMWRTGVFALNEKIQKYLKLNDNQKVIGYLYVGTATGKQKKIPEMDTSEFVTEWI